MDIELMATNSWLAVNASQWVLEKNKATPLVIKKSHLLGAWGKGAIKQGLMCVECVGGFVLDEWTEAINECGMKDPHKSTCVCLFKAQLYDS